MAKLGGNIITVDEVFFEHRDQLNCCYYSWPLKSDPQFLNCFEFSKEGMFKPQNIPERFAFIEPCTGTLCVKNGSREYQINGAGWPENEADIIIDLAKKLSGCVICWTDFPRGQELRDFLSHVEVDDIFTKALNYEFGSASNPNIATEKREAGRPSKRFAAYRAYRTHFPDGHETFGKTWKEALATVIDVLGAPIHEDTLKRAIRSEGQKEQ